MSACGTWPISWPTLVNIGITGLLNGNYGRLGIPERANYYAPSEPVKSWTVYAPTLDLAFHIAFEHVVPSWAYCLRHLTVSSSWLLRSRCCLPPL